MRVHEGSCFGSLYLPACPDKLPLCPLVSSTAEPATSHRCSHDCHGCRHWPSSYNPYRLARTARNHYYSTCNDWEELRDRWAHASGQRVLTKSFFLPVCVVLCVLFKPSHPSPTSSPTVRAHAIAHQSPTCSPTPTTPELAPPLCSKRLGESRLSRLSTLGTPAGPVGGTPKPLIGG